MLEAVFELNENLDTICLRVSGHAGAAKKGHDLVCAAASILAYTLAQIALIMDNDKKLRRTPKIKLNEGDTVITVRPKREYYDEALYAFYHSEIGFSILAGNYPNFVKITPFCRKDA